MKKTLIAASLVLALTACNTITTNADTYVEAIKTQDIATLQSFENEQVKRDAINDKSSTTKNKQFSKYPLHTAVQYSATESIKFFISNHYDINQHNNNGQTPLTLALQLQNFDIAKLLLKLGAKPSVENKDGLIPLLVVSSLANVDQDLLTQLMFTNLDFEKEYQGKTVIEHVNQSSSWSNEQKSKFSQQVEDFLKLKEKRNHLVESIRDNSYSVLEEFINQGLSLDFEDITYYSPLMMAVKQQNVPMVEYILQNGANPNFQDTEYGETALTVAAKNNNTDIVELLMKHFANPDLANLNKITPLIMAVSENQLAVANELIKYKADVNATSTKGWSAIHWAVNSKDNQSFDGSEFIKSLIAAGAKIEQKTEAGNTALQLAILNSWPESFDVLINNKAYIHTRDNDNMTPLINAVTSNELEMTRTLLEKGAKVNASDKEGWAPLHWTVNSYKYQMHSGVELMQLLLEFGADINQPNKDDRRPLSLAILNNRKAEFNVLMDNSVYVNYQQKDSFTPTMLAASNNNYKMVKRLIEAGADLEIADSDGWAPIHWTVNSAENQTHDGTKILTLLIDSGADINQRILAGHTPLNMAISNNRFNEFNVLLERGADIEKPTRNGFTPLINASSEGELEMVKQLIAKGAELNEQNKNGWSALHYSVNSDEYKKESHVDIAKALIEAGAKLNLVTEKGSTAINLAAINGHPETLKYLIDAGADITIIDNDGWTPVISAVMSNEVDIVNQLVVAGADVNKADKQGWAPIHWAVNQRKYQKHDGSNLLQVLLGSGANVNLQTEDGHTAVNLSILNDRENEFNIIMSFNPDLNLNDKDGWTPMISAVVGNEISMVKSLLKATNKVDLDYADKDGWTALHYTVNNKKNQKHDGSELIKLLVNAGANMAAKQKDGYTPLMLAGYFGRVNEAKVLLDIEKQKFH